MEAEDCSLWLHICFLYYQRVDEWTTISNSATLEGENRTCGVWKKLWYWKWGLVFLFFFFLSTPPSFTLVVFLYNPWSLNTIECLTPFHLRDLNIPGRLQFPKQPEPTHINGNHPTPPTIFTPFKKTKRPTWWIPSLLLLLLLSTLQWKNRCLVAHHLGDITSTCFIVKWIPYSTLLHPHPHHLLHCLLDLYYLKTNIQQHSVDQRNHLLEAGLVCLEDRQLYASSSSFMWSSPSFYLFIIFGPGLLLNRWTPSLVTGGYHNGHMIKIRRTPSWTIWRMGWRCPRCSPRRIMTQPTPLNRFGSRLQKLLPSMILVLLLWLLLAHGPNWNVW